MLLITRDATGRATVLRPSQREALSVTDTFGAERDSLTLSLHPEVDPAVLTGLRTGSLELVETPTLSPTDADAATLERLLRMGATFVTTPYDLVRLADSEEGDHITLVAVKGRDFEDLYATQEGSGRPGDIADQVAAQITQPAEPYFSWLRDDYFAIGNRDRAIAFIRDSAVAEAATARDLGGVRQALSKWGLTISVERAGQLGLVAIVHPRYPVTLTGTSRLLPVRVPRVYVRQPELIELRPTDVVEKFPEITVPDGRNRPGSYRDREIRLTQVTFIEGVEDITTIDEGARQPTLILDQTLPQGFGKAVEELARWRLQNESVTATIRLPQPAHEFRPHDLVKLQEEHLPPPYRVSPSEARLALERRLDALAGVHRNLLDAYQAAALQRARDEQARALLAGQQADLEAELRAVTEALGRRDPDTIRNIDDPASWSGAYRDRQLAWTALAIDEDQYTGAQVSVWDATRVGVLSASLAGALILGGIGIASAIAILSTAGIVNIVAVAGGTGLVLGVSGGGVGLAAIAGGSTLFAITGTTLAIATGGVIVAVAALAGGGYLLYRTLQPGEILEGDGDFIPNSSLYDQSVLQEFYGQEIEADPDTPGSTSLDPKSPLSGDPDEDEIRLHWQLLTRVLTAFNNGEDLSASDWFDYIANRRQRVLTELQGTVARLRGSASEEGSLRWLETEITRVRGELAALPSEETDSALQERLQILEFQQTQGRDLVDREAELVLDVEQTFSQAAGEGYSFEALERITPPGLELDLWRQMDRVGRLLRRSGELLSQITRLQAERDAIPLTELPDLSPYTKAVEAIQAEIAALGEPEPLTTWLITSATRVSSATQGAYVELACTLWQGPFQRYRTLEESSA